MNQSAWATGRPIYHRLPQAEQQYQGNEVCDWLTQPADDLLISLKVALSNLEQDYINPDTAKSEVLDWLAQYHGFEGDYWDATWPDIIKRQIIKYSWSFIWTHKGQKSLLEWLLSVFGIDALVVAPGDCIAGIAIANDIVGGEPLKYFIAMQIPSKGGYLRISPEWQLTIKLNRLYMPCYSDSLVCYKKAIAGLAVAGDPLLDLE